MGCIIRCGKLYLNKISINMYTEHTFTLTLPNTSTLTDDQVDAIYDAGCDDATISECDGVVSLTFTREAPTREEAIRSAVADIAKVFVDMVAVGV